MDRLLCSGFEPAFSQLGRCCRADARRAVWQRSKFASQIANVNINAAVKRTVLPVRNLFQQVSSMKDASVATQEDCEQIKLDGREVDELALAATGTRASVQGKI